MDHPRIELGSVEDGEVFVNGRSTFLWDLVSDGAIYSLVLDVVLNSGQEHEYVKCFRDHASAAELTAQYRGIMTELRMERERERAEAEREIDEEDDPPSPRDVGNGRNPFLGRLRLGLEDLTSPFRVRMDTRGPANLDIPFRNAVLSPFSRPAQEEIGKVTKWYLRKRDAYLFSDLQKSAESMVATLNAFNQGTMAKAPYQTYRRVYNGNGKSINHNFYSGDVNWNWDIFEIFLGEARPVLMTFFANLMTAMIRKAQLDVSEETAVRLKRQVDDHLKPVWRRAEARLDTLMGEVWERCRQVGTGYQHSIKVKKVMREFIESETRGGAMNMFLQLICILVEEFEEWAMTVIEWFLITVAPVEPEDDDMDAEWR